VGDSIAEGEALAATAWASTWGHNLEGALRFAKDALAVAEPAGALGIQGRAHFAIGFVRGVTGGLDESHTSLDKAVALTRAAGDAMGQSMSLSAAGLLRNWSGDYAAAIELQDQAFVLARKSGRLQPLTFNYFLRGLTLTGKGDYDAAFAAMNEGLALAEHIGDEAFRHRLMNSLGWLYAELGDLDQAETLNAISAQIGRRRRDPGTQPNAELNLGEVMRSRGDLTLAQDMYNRVFKYYNNPSASLWMRYRYSIRMFAGLGDLALRRGDLSTARDHSATCLDLATRTASRKNLVKGWRLAGQVARAQKDWDRAEGHLRTALDLAIALGNPVQYWQTEIALGQLLDDVGRSQEARQAFHRAHVRLQEVGANLRDERLRAAFAKSAELQFVQQADVPSDY
jgi:tetratricopeptide (TPR) repeat protein